MKHIPIAACTSDACGSGKRSCPCPESCQLPEGEASPGLLYWALVFIGLVSAALLADRPPI